MNLKRNLIFVFFFLQMGFIMGQEFDHAVWSSIKFSSKINEKLSLDYRPHQRIDRGISKLEFVSFDISGRYKLGKGWSVHALSRSIGIPNKLPRYFFFFDVKHEFKLDSYRLSIGNQIRYHYGVDANVTDPDFLRYSLAIKHKLHKLITLNAGFEPFLGVGENINLSRMRYRLGFNYQLDQKLNFNFNFWIEDFVGRNPRKTMFIYLPTISYKL